VKTAIGHQAVENRRRIFLDYGENACAVSFRRARPATENRIPTPPPVSVETVVPIKSKKAMRQSANARDYVITIRHPARERCDKETR